MRAKENDPVGAGRDPPYIEVTIGMGRWLLTARECIAMPTFEMGMHGAICNKWRDN